MNQDNTLNVKLSNSQLNKLKLRIKNGSEVILNFSQSVIGNSNDETTFLHKLLLTNKQVLRIYKAFENNSPAITKLSKTQLSKEDKPGEVRIIENSCRLLDALLKIGLPLMKNVLKPLTKSVLTPFGLPAAVSTIDVAVGNTIFGSGLMALIISDEEMGYIIKIVPSLEESIFYKRC